MSSQAGWYGDPVRRYEYRYWDGLRWTHHVSSGGVAEVDARPLADHDIGASEPESARDAHNVTPTVILSKAASALIEQPSFHMPRLGEQALEEAGGQPRSVDWVIERFRRHFGGLWVGGRVTLSTASVKFAPNALNRATHSGALEVEIPLREIVRVEVLPGIVTKIVAIQTTEGVLKVRCYGAPTLAAAIQSASGN